MKILVTGSKGQLGSELEYLSKDINTHYWKFFDKEEFDLTDNNQLSTIISTHKPDILINCAAYTNVEKAESDKDLANKLNHEVIAKIAQYCNKLNIKLIHISTDYVFDGTSNIPLKEHSITNPINYYGITKLLGDTACIQNCPDSIILRTSWVYSSYGNNFVKTMMRLMSENEELNVINDQIGSPTYARDLALTIIKIIKNEKWEPGIYNYSNEGEISWYDFACSIKQLNGFTTNLKPIKTEEFKTLAKRPKYSLLDKSKIKNTYNIKVPNYFESLQKCIKILKNEK